MNEPLIDAIHKTAYQTTGHIFTRLVIQRQRCTDSDGDLTLFNPEANTYSPLGMLISTSSHIVYDRDSPAPVADFAKSRYNSGPNGPFISAHHQLIEAMERVHEFGIGYEYPYPAANPGKRERLLEYWVDRLSDALSRDLPDSVRQWAGLSLTPSNEQPSPDDQAKTQNSGFSNPTQSPKAIVTAEELSALLNNAAADTKPVLDALIQAAEIANAIAGHQSIEGDGWKLTVEQPPADLPDWLNPPTLASGTLCWVGDCNEEELDAPNTSTDAKAAICLIVGKNSEGKYVARSGTTWAYARPVTPEELAR